MSSGHLQGSEGPSTLRRSSLGQASSQKITDAGDGGGDGGAAGSGSYGGGPVVVVICGGEGDGWPLVTFQS